MLTVDEADETSSRYWRPTGFARKPIFTTSSVEAVRSMVAAGMGVTILSDMVYRPWSLEGQRDRAQRHRRASRPWMSASPGIPTPSARRGADFSGAPVADVRRGRARSQRLSFQGRVAGGACSPRVPDDTQTRGSTL